jgi:hypothetical protein
MTRGVLRAIPVDAIALLAIALAVVVTHLPFAGRGMCFNDPAWFFHFGHRVADGDVPYRDFVWQVGPLPLYVEAGFQDLFGTRYMASLYVGMLVLVLRVFVIWLIVRRVASLRAAALLAVFCALDPLFGMAHDWSTSWAELCFSASGLCFVLALRAEGRRELLHLALAGFSASLVVSARQSAWVLITAVLLGASVVMALRREYFTPRRLAALWAGFCAALVLLAAVLAAQGALGAAIQQMFLDAPQKKGLSGVNAILDAISGGAMLDGNYTKLTGFLFFIGLPIVYVTGVFLLARREAPIPSATLGFLLIPGTLAAALLMRDASLDCATDLPRTFLTATTALAVLAPDRMRRWLGLEPVAAIGLGALPLASEWSLEMSFPGHGWSDVWATITGGLLLGLASRHVTERAKTAICGVLAVAGLVHVGVYLRVDVNPFAHMNAVDGTLAENRFTPHPRGAPHPMLRGIEVPEWRARALEWVAAQVPPGSTCFIYANLPSLYDLLGCTNPTKVDTTIADFYSEGDAAAAAAALRAHPPDFILAYDNMWMSPNIKLDLGGDVGRYDSWNPRATMKLHMGLRAIIDQYDDLGLAGTAMGPELAKLASYRWDVVDGIRIYKRRTAAAAGAQL